ncbi:MAG: type II toxin-antitoxin system Phd/YefM family antitoxin [Planctomycetota bacterium]|nr:type II toxin-antitoxin system Phd/YefM family antitoxin [Planctomycetota bacterium]
MASGRFVRANDLQYRSSSVLRDINQTGEPCYITENGKAKAVLMDINRYHALMDVVEEAESPRDHVIGDETRKHVCVRDIIRRSTRVMRRRRV